MDDSITGGAPLERQREQPGGRPAESRPATAGEQGGPRPIEDLIGAGRSVAMVMTMIGSEHSSRPVTVAEVLHGRLSFLVSREVDWVAAIAAGEAGVHVTVAEPDRTTFLSLDGTASLVLDEAERDRLWTPMAKAWFDGPDDPTLAVLRFDVTGGKYWDGPSGAVRRGFALLKAAVSGDGTDVGTSGPVAAG
jgi:general stress protein 26